MAAYLRMADLVKRWIYTRRGLEKLIGRGGFPEPQIVAGRTRLWYAADIVTFESNHPELTSEEAKRRKVRGFAIARSKGRKA